MLTIKLGAYLIGTCGSSLTMFVYILHQKFINMQYYKWSLSNIRRLLKLNLFKTEQHSIKDVFNKF